MRRLAVMPPLQAFDQLSPHFQEVQVDGGQRRRQSEFVLSQLPTLADEAQKCPRTCGRRLIATARRANPVRSAQASDQPGLCFGTQGIRAPASAARP